MESAMKTTDHGAFLEEHGLPTDVPASVWQTQMPVLVPYRCLIATQRPATWPCGRIRKRLGEPSRSGDPYPYVLVVRGLAWIYDGHHRIAEDLAAGKEWGEVKLAWWQR